MDLQTLVGPAAFVINILVIVWTASRSAAKTEASIEKAIAAEREKRAEQFYEAREFARAQAANAVGKADAAHVKIQDVELRVLQMFTNYPTKSDMREMFGEKLDPITNRLDAVYDELMRRGVHSPTRHQSTSEYTP
jgi:hypothetical protein